jgi:hypothetical protein
VKDVISFQKTSFTAAVGKQAIKKQLHTFEAVTASYNLFICLPARIAERVWWAEDF